MGRRRDAVRTRAWCDVTILVTISNYLLAYSVDVFGFLMNVWKLHVGYEYFSRTLGKLSITVSYT